MKRIVWLAAALAIAVAGVWLIRDSSPEVLPAAEDGDVMLPSGLGARLQEMIWNEPGQGLVYRFRFVAEGFSETEEVEKVMADLLYLCTHFALDRLANLGPTPGRVIVSLADQPSEFGTFDPAVIQVFEAFRIENGSCIWEAF